MNKLLIHIGYPKTATTTIQENLFIKLHEAGLINYFGRDNYSNNISFKHADRILKSFNLNEGFNLDDLKFSTDKVNVISIEELSVPIYSRLIYSREIKTGRNTVDPFEYQVDPFEYPKRLFSLFNNAVDTIDIMVTIRNQKDLIYSFYVQVYDLFANNKSNDTPAKFIFDDGYAVRKKRLKNYYFPDLVEKYEECFGKDNIHILLFEDLLYDPSFINNQLSQMLNVENSLVQNLLANSHLNKRRKTKTGYHREIRKATALSNVVDKLRKIDMVDNLISKIINSYKVRYGSDNKILNMIRKLMHKEGHVIVPKLNEKEQNIIFDEFRESNLKLSERYHIDQEKLKKYGYI